MKLDKYTVGKRYGKAIFELAVESGTEERILEELQTVKEIFDDNPGLGNMLSVPALNLHEKRALMDTINQHFDGLVHDALEIIFQYGRMYDIDQIINEFQTEYNEAKKIVLAKVTTAVALNETQKQKLSQVVAKRFGYQSALVEEKIDPKIIGGVIVEANHQLIDGSVKSRFDQLRKVLGN